MPYQKTTRYALSLPERIIRSLFGILAGTARGIAAFQASPVWVLAALSDFAGGSRELTSEIAEAMQTAGIANRQAQAGGQADVSTSNWSKSGPLRGWTDRQSGPVGQR